MKNNIPRYNKHDKEQVKVFEGLSDKNKKIIEKEVIRWSASAGENKVQSKKKNLVKLADIIEIDLDKITFDIYLEVAKLINHSDLADSTKNDFRKNIKEFIRDNYPNWSMKFNSFKELKTHKESIPEKYEDLPKPKDFERLIKKTDSIMFKTLIQIMIETGARGSEVLRTKWKDWSSEKKNIKLISTKNKGVRILPLYQSQKHLERWKKEYCYDNSTPEDYIFPSLTKRENPMILNYLNKKLRILGREVLGKSITSYFIRHSALTHLQKKLPAKLYEKIADHSIQTASKYSHLNTDDLKEAMEDLVYNVEELTEGERDRIDELEKAFAKINNRLDRIERMKKVAKE